MHIQRSIFLSCLLLIAVTACKRSTTTQLASGSSKATPPIQESGEAFFDVCSLITKAQIEAVMGSPIKDTKSSGHADGIFRVSQCFYTAEEFSKSVSLAVTQTDPNSTARRSPRDFWKETFGRYAQEEKEREGDKEKKESLRDQARRDGEEKESIPPKNIGGVGEKAFWVRNRFGGILSVLKGDAFISISLGGTDDEDTKLKKSKVLAQKALQRL